MCVCVSHVAVISLQQQLLVCVQQLYYPQILVDHSHHYLQRREGVEEIINNVLRAFITYNTNISKAFGWQIKTMNQQYLGEIVVCHNVKPGRDDWSLCCRMNENTPATIHDIWKHCNMSVPGHADVIFKCDYFKI